MSCDDDKRLVYKVIYRLERGNVLLSGSGGTGKSFLLKNVAEQLKKENYCVYITATTGVAALSLTDKSRELYGTTLHSWAGIGRGEEPVEKLLSKICFANKKAQKRWMKVNVLIIDEVSMLGGRLFSKLDILGKRLRNCDLPFGGIKLLVCGDFLQLPPINDIWVFETQNWNELDLFPIILSEPKRFDDLTYFEMLSNFRYGTVTDKDYTFLETCFDKFIKWKKEKKNSKGNVDVIQPTFLFSKKVDVDHYNKRKLNKLPGNDIIFKAKDVLTMKRKKNINRDLLETYMDDSIPNTIALKVGAQVMLKVNLSVENGLVNGSRGVILSVDEISENPEEETHLLGVFVKWKDGSQTYVTNYVWTYEDKNIVYKRQQIPLILAWSHSIHKSQSITLDYAVCNIGNQIFTDAQAYVALSRVRNREGLFINDLERKSIRANKKAIEYTKTIEEEFKTRETIKYIYLTLTKDF